VISTLANLDAATWATLAAGIGSAAAGLGGKWFGHRSAVRKIESGVAERIADGYGDLLQEMQVQLRTSRVDRSALHDDIALLRVRLREVESTARIAATKFEQLLDHVRILRTILRSHSIEHPAGPDFLNESGDESVTNQHK
jgi:hypothetical protein